ncbi:helix-turn-helix domain-containing protein [Propioniciclava soli]|uniref:helix-turn-helix domain-containing protein n=1 Tax=Propioniciclava soli TaxID=2775081 RepID=UPI001E4A9723|nr:helix-turn-helix transcriptional regulator [Propioniciclava soli]
MDTKAEVSDFLRTRRDRLTPERAGLPLWGGNRRVSGLRREEVAMLAGVSVDYYTRLERGNLAGVSEGVLAALADALQLDEAERAHLADLAATANASGRNRPRTTTRRVRPTVQWLLDGMRDTPAYVRNARADLLAANALGRALYAPLWEMRRPNVARFVFLDPAAPEFFTDWDEVADASAALLRSLGGQYPHDRGLHDLVGELSTRSDAFAQRWAAHNVRQHRTGTKRIHHPVVGSLTLSYEAMTLTADEGLTLNAYMAEPGTADAQALGLLASWVGNQASDPVAAEAG